MLRQSEFNYAEIKELGICLKGSSQAEIVKCVGSLEEELEVITKSLKCGGKVTKQRTKGAGKGTVKVNVRIPWDTYVKMFGMEDENLIDGVVSYGENSIHPIFKLTGRVVDEDDNDMLVAYPNATIMSNQTTKIQNDQVDIAAVDLDITITPDEYGNGVYKSIVEDLEESTISDEWMKNFSTTLIRVKEA